MLGYVPYGHVTRGYSAMKRLAAVLVLALLSPLIAEYLSGSLSFAVISALPVLILMYGGGAVLIRELARRAGRGWPTIIALALAYGVIEEGLGDQSLFNPHFRGLHLLTDGFIPALGIGVPWTIYVLGIHVVWSIAVPVALTESLFPNLRLKPWLGYVGLAIVALLYMAGVGLVLNYTAAHEHFMASMPQLVGSGVVTVALIIFAFLLPRVKSKMPGAVPSVWLTGIFAFVTLSGFVLCYGLFAHLFGWPWPAISVGMVLCGTAAALLGGIAGLRSDWSPAHTFAMGAGALLVYCWHGFFTEMSLYGKAMLVPHALLAAALVVPVVLAGVRIRTAAE